MAEKWFERAIVAGFQGLITLRLDGAPPADAVNLTLDIWLVALTKNRKWDEAEDAERIRETFESLFASCERWPSPARFMRDLKPRKLPPGLPKPERSQAQVERGQPLPQLQCLPPAQPPAELMRLPPEPEPLTT